MVLFQIVSSENSQQSVLDVTPFIVAGSYNVVTKPEYEEWNDGYHTLRRTIKGWKLSGSFNLMFFSLTDYNNFLTAVESNIQNGGYIYVTLYDNKTKKLFTKYVFIDYDLPDLAPLVGRSDNDEITVTVTQRDIMTRSEVIHQEEINIGEPPVGGNQEEVSTGDPPVGEDPEPIQQDT